MEASGDSADASARMYMGHFDDEDDSDEWNEVQVDSDPPTHCLFCSQYYQTTYEAICHANKVHNFDMIKLKTRFDMDCYSFIKMINYIRSNSVEASVLMESEVPLWDDEKYLKPVQVDDPWLMFDFEDLECSSEQSINNGYHVVNAENGRITLSEQHFVELQRTIQRLSAEVREKDSLLGSALADMATMRVTTQSLVSMAEETEPMTADTLSRCVASVRLEDDQSYFNTYAHFGIHHEMLSDDVRTSTYRDALLQNATVLEGKTVLDLGCGTGILSMFAASAGARVVGIDQSDIIYHAMDIIRENNLEDRITLIKGRLEDTSLPESHVDVIVSEWMGYFLLFEGMLDSLIYARDHHLKEGGKLLPNRCSMSLAGVSDPERHAQLVGFWSDVYGYRMTCLRQEVVREATVETVAAAAVVTEPCEINSLDLYTCTATAPDFSSEFEMPITRSALLTQLVGYFDTHFDLPCPVSFSTGPHAPPTHWKQAIFFLEEPFPVTEGEVLAGKLICQRSKDVRHLTITILLQGRKYKYMLG